MPGKLEFRVVHVSGQDDGFKATELNTHSPTTKGWQSSRFCLYPQDMVLQLDKKSRMRKLQILVHQYNIATKIEFYVGDVPEDTPVTLQNARYTRLGYVCMSDNEKTGFKARELKSVHVDAVGSFLKLVIHKNHVNKHNLYNQVGIIAVNVIGDEIKNIYDPSNLEGDPYIDDPRLKQDPALAGLLNKPDYISPLDDLAFDMYQDPEVAQIIRKLERKKQEAVLEERYDFAKKVKQAITDLQKVGEKLGKMEVEKRQAVESEDYDKAKLKKVQMDEYRLQVYKQLQLHDLLEVSGSKHPQPVTIEPVRQQTPPPKLERLEKTPTPPPLPPPESRSGKLPYDERPLPALKKTQSPRDVEDEAEGSGSPPPTARQPPPAESPPPPLDESGGTGGGTGGGITEGPEEMSEKDLREASILIDVFGQPLAAKAYSKTWSFREDAINSVQKELRDLPTSSPKEETRNMLRAAIFLVQRGIKDKVQAVFKAALSLLRFILKDFISLHKLGKSETSYAVEKTLPGLIQRSGDTAARIRDEAKAFVLDIAQYPDVKATHLVPSECTKPFKPSAAPRLSLSKTEIVEQLYRDLGLENNGLTVDNLMKFCVAALQHNNGEIRHVAERIIIDLYKTVGAPVKDFLPPDDDKTRKNTLYRQIFEAFDKIDGKPSKEELKRQKAEEEKKKAAEIEALQAQLAALKDLSKSSGPAEDTGKGGTNVKDEKKKPKGAPHAKPKVKPPPEEDDTSTLFQIDKTCIFCGEKDEAFTEEGLDVHYWKSCPMLKRCTDCKQVVEIASFTEHQISECEAKGNFSKCPRCTEAIPNTEFDQHIKDKTCNAAVADQSHCPLCHENIPQGEEGWKNHLMGKDGCKHNPRRLQALNKAGKQAGGVNKGKSKLPMRGRGRGRGGIPKR
ncbi:centrosomal protein of 104 kDa isoform X2 [Lingula anatina]|uniref:Centrosomal protein of 104 kDa n=1 Tax=Lingula anatina TaxID=7574 RepID=A0A1S3JR49_LINAN|nr:centrosomal protein of 104 kDa isoform X2 [Lingula anatina]|eukprot:XP_013412883.1 centrosomal protein of 104 kDa isoform X2 [Lingula anatina]